MSTLELSCRTNTYSVSSMFIGMRACQTLPDKLDAWNY